MPPANNSPLVSVGMPTTRSNFIHAALNSVIDQIYKNFELIIVDDSPNDEAKKILESYSDKRIRYYTTNRSKTGKTQSAATTWNTCLNLAQGQYFVLFADDDVLDHAFLEEMVQLATQHPEKIILQCRFRNIDEMGNPGKSSPLCPDVESGPDFILNHIQENRKIRCVNYMYDRDALVQQGGYIDLPVGWGSDVLTNYTMSMKGGIASTNNLLCDWRSSRYNITSAAALEEKLKALDLHATLLGSILDEQPDHGGQVNEQPQVIRTIQRIFPHRIHSQKTALILSHLNEKNPGAGILSKVLTLNRKYGIPLSSLIKLFLKQRSPFKAANRSK